MLGKKKYQLQSVSELKLGSLNVRHYISLHINLLNKSINGNLRPQNNNVHTDQIESLNRQHTTHTSCCPLDTAFLNILSL